MFLIVTEKKKALAFRESKLDFKGIFKYRDCNGDFPFFPVKPSHNYYLVSLIIFTQRVDIKWILQQNHLQSAQSQFTKIFNKTGTSLRQVFLIDA